MKHYTKSLFAVTFLALLLFSIGESTELVSAADITPNVEPPSQPVQTKWGAVRYKAFYYGTGGEVYLGPPDLGGPPRVEINCIWQQSIPNHVIFTYDPVTGKETTTVNVGTYYYQEYPIGTMGAPNFVYIMVVNRTTGTTVDFNTVTLNGESLGNFSALPYEGVTGWKKWLVTGVDMTNGFTLDGDIVLTGPQPGNEMNKVEIAFGYVPSLDITTSSPLPSGKLDVPYSQTVAATGGIPPYSWGGSGLPGGLTINGTTGEISGTPTATGSFTPPIQVTDAIASTAVKGFSLDILSNPVRIIGTPHRYFTAIQTAYNNCSDDDTIQCQAVALSGDVLCDTLNMSVTLKGGYDANFTSNPGYTTINGTMTISNGPVTVENIIIK